MKDLNEAIDRAIADAREHPERWLPFADQLKYAQGDIAALRIENDRLRDLINEAGQTYCHADEEWSCGVRGVLREGLAEIGGSTP